MLQNTANPPANELQNTPLQPQDENSTPPVPTTDLNNRLDVRHVYAAYRRNQLSHGRFLLALAACLRAYTGPGVSAEDKFLFANKIRRHQCDSPEIVTLALESLVAWCDLHSIVLVDL
jgi:hypothetical protein